MVQVIKIEDQEDGGAIIQVDMEHEELVHLAKIGFLQLLKEACMREPETFIDMKELRNEGFHRTISGLDRPVSDS